MLTFFLGQYGQYLRLHSVMSFIFIVYCISVYMKNSDEKVNELYFLFHENCVIFYYVWPDIVKIRGFSTRTYLNASRMMISKFKKRLQYRTILQLKCNTNAVFQ